MVPYLDLIHGHDGPGRSLGAKAIPDALIKRHAVELTVVSGLPPERMG